METLEALSSRIGTTEEIRSIVRTMKSLSAVSIRQYERAAEAIRTYNETVELGLQVVLREHPARTRTALTRAGRTREERTAAIVFGSDRGLCGRFNERVANRARRELGGRGGAKPILLVVGARAAARLEALGLPPQEVFFLPGSAAGIARTARSIIVEADRWQREEGVTRIRLHHNRRAEGGEVRPVSRTLLPVSADYLRALAERPWPTRQLPTFTMETDALFSWLIREHLLVSLIGAGAESLASEHAARLAAMKSAERSIDERLDQLSASYRQKRQDAITTEILDIVTGAEAMRSRSTG